MMRMVSLGISVSDFNEQCGHTAPEVYALVDHVEYGGFELARDNKELEYALSVNPELNIGRHMVSTELPSKLVITSEASQIIEDMSGLDTQYFLTDFEYWHYGGRDIGNVWPRPAALNHDVMQRVAQNCRALTEQAGVSILAENPAIIAIDQDQTIGEFMGNLAQKGVDLCLDIGHFWAYCKNFDLDVGAELNKLSFSSIRVVHIAGLSKVKFYGRDFYLDNHDIQPLPECLELLRYVLGRGCNIAWVTYEAELANDRVKIAGLQSIRAILG